MKETKKQMSEDMPISGCAHCNGRNSGTMCGPCGCGSKQHTFTILRWLLGMLILLMTFWLGAKVGEFKSLYIDNDLGMGFGRHFMMTRSYPNNMMFSSGQIELNTTESPELQDATQTTPTPKATLPNKLK